jgi:hypothetical protein
LLLLWQWAAGFGAAQRMLTRMELDIVTQTVGVTSSNDCILCRHCTQSVMAAGSLLVLLTRMELDIATQTAVVM